MKTTESISQCEGVVVMMNETITARVEENVLLQYALGDVLNIIERAGRDMGLPEDAIRAATSSTGFPVPPIRRGEPGYIDIGRVDIGSA